MFQPAKIGVTCGRFSWCVEALESRILLTAIGFAKHDLSVDGPTRLEYLGDFDGDQRTDILISKDDIVTDTQPVSWFPGMDENGQLRAPVRLDLGEFSNRAMLEFLDVEQDGDADLVGWHAGEYVLIENEAGEFGSPQPLVPRPKAGERIWFGDVDADGDVDRLSTVDGRVLRWYENTGQALAPAKELFRFESQSFSQRLVDWDGDGDADIFGTDTFRDAFWLENMGSGTYQAHLILDVSSEAVVQTLGGGAMSHIEDGDLDGDGVPELIANSVRISSGKLEARFSVWHRVDGQYVPVLDLSPLKGWAYPVDLNNDGHLDLFNVQASSSHGQAFADFSWYENLLVGDVDRSGDVGFADFLRLAANFGKQVDAAWTDGDFDRNGRVDYDDFLALAANYGAIREPA